MGKIMRASVLIPRSMGMARIIEVTFLCYFVYYDNWDRSGFTHKLGRAKHYSLVQNHTMKLWFWAPQGYKTQRETRKRCCVYESHQRTIYNQHRVGAQGGNECVSTTSQGGLYREEATRELSLTEYFHDLRWL